jgi:hypothetical protein
MQLISWGRGDAVALLYALWKKERYEAKGFRAFVHHGVFPNDAPWEVYVFPKARSCPTCHGTGVFHC